MEDIPDYFLWERMSDCEVTFITSAPISLAKILFYSPNLSAKRLRIIMKARRTKIDEHAASLYHDYSSSPTTILTCKI